MTCRQISQIILLLTSVNVIWCIPLSQFYPYGPDAEEAVTKIAKGNDVFSPIIFTKFPFYFYGQRRESVIVSVNGALTFYEMAPEFTSNTFPLGDNREMVAPFWADIDTSRKGNVWYHKTSDPISLRRASKEIQEVYPEANYTAKGLFIATWEHVGYYNSTTTKTNTFQCILSMNEIQSYVIFLYADGEIQWTTGDADGGVNGLGGIPAQIGINKGDGVGFKTITKSRTHDIIKIASASNIGVPGVLIFKISDTDISIKNLNFSSNDDDDEMTDAKHEYYLSFIDNYSDSKTSILITTTDSEPVSYSVQAPGIGFYHSGTVTTDYEAIVDFPNTAKVTSHIDQNKGIYLKASSNSITVIGQNSAISTSDTFLVQPITRLSSTMYVYYGISTQRFIDNTIFNSSILLVGIENDTTMKLKVTQSVTISVGAITTNLISGKYYSFVINRLQTIYIESIKDLSGTKVIADKQLSVFSGHECGNLPNNFPYCDHLVEQIPPTTLWGKICYTAPFASRKSYTIKILVAYDSTTIAINCNNSMESHVINEGDIFVKTLQLQEYCTISSNNEILVAQFGLGYYDDRVGDPMMTLVPTTNQYSYKFKFSTLRNISHSQSYNHYINIIVMAQYYQPNMIYLIAGGVHKSLNTQQWVPIKSNNIIEAYATQVNIPEGVVEIVHSNTSALMTTVVYGFGRLYEGYGHPGGLFSDLKSNSGPPPNFVMSPSNQTVELSTNNHNVSLRCMANNTLSYIWDRQNDGIPSGAIGKYSNILILINVQPKDSGNYRCVATNNHGTKMSDYATIIIKEKPCKITNVTGEVMVDENNVTIVFSADNSLVNFQCRLDNKKLSFCSNPTTWTDVKSGQHSITLVAKCPKTEGKKQVAKKRYKFQIA